jgi:hypothetical protein
MGSVIMSLCRIETEDGTFHGQLIYGDDDEIIGEELLLDESGDPIPISICLCFAHAPSECCCETTGWDNYRYWDDDY